MTQCHVVATRFRLATLAADCGGRLLGEDVDIARVHTDTRSIATGDLFVALRGERFDGNLFAAQALQAGAVAALVEREDALPAGASGIVVADARRALGAIARAHRHRIAPKVLAVTGSNGKTTVKEMLAAILRHVHGEAAVLATEGNLNNDIGLPLTLLRLEPQHQFAVCEMGMNHTGEIASLCGIAEPDIAVINNAGTAHLENLGSLEGIARAKGEIVQGLGSAGIAVLPQTDRWLALWQHFADARTALTFGLDPAAQVSGTVTGDTDGAVTVSHAGATATCRLAIPGRHNAHNACAAVAAALAAGVGLADAVTALEGFGGAKGRLQVKRAANGATLIDDTYNANPDSMEAAIAVLAGRAQPRILVLGDMGELGPDEAALHREVGAAARAAGLECLLVTGELSRHMVAGFGAGAEHFASHAALIDALRARLTPATTALVKGSRFMRMEQVVEALAAPADDGATGSAIAPGITRKEAACC
ncbi:MAG: UDP-N-acetylmuramoyl-tripeptide--D-alanyl-D-alanine ligase [Rhodocyclaceae bacterium]|nr:UDP-N-acetylmuramoyl-tripeptide--D-alanyl-D-alanine ligase [Rhodocyclaceae bacterium]